MRPVKPFVPTMLTAVTRPASPSITGRLLAVLVALFALLT